MKNSERLKITLPKFIIAACLTAGFSRAAHEVIQRQQEVEMVTAALVEDIQANSKQLVLWRGRIFGRCADHVCAKGQIIEAPSANKPGKFAVAITPPWDRRAGILEMPFYDRTNATFYRIPSMTEKAAIAEISGDQASGVEVSALAYGGRMEAYASKVPPNSPGR